MEAVFLDIMKQLEGVEGARYVGEDWGQLNFENPPVAFPCILIDLGSVKYSQRGGASKLADPAVLNITIADMRYSGITPTMPAQARDQAFGIFSIIEGVGQRLHCHGGKTYGRLCHMETKKVMRPDSVREFLLTFQFSFTDSSAAPKMVRCPVPPDIQRE